MTPAPEPRVVRAGNRGPFTLGGTRTFLVGRQSVAVVDPGPDVEDHVRALSVALSGATDVSILLTHGHSDHAGCARQLSEVVDAPVYGPISTDFRPLVEGDSIATDEGELLVWSTPGHTSDHLVYQWPLGRALFAGDMFLGLGSTTWLGEYSGCVADYLSSLAKVQDLRVDRIFPAHGSPLENPTEAVERFRSHRLDRLREVAQARDRNPGASSEELLTIIYGKELAPKLLKAALPGIDVMLHHLDSVGLTDR